jgi:hypothetical protein
LGQITLASLFLASVLQSLRGHAGPVWVCLKIAAAGSVYGLTLLALDTFSFAPRGTAMVVRRPQRISIGVRGEQVSFAPMPSYGHLAP